jgi:hypothetical protein
VNMTYDRTYEWCSEDGASDKEFLGWIYTRLSAKCSDTECALHMKRLKSIIHKTPGKIKIGCDCTAGDECPQGKRGMEQRCSIWKE